MRLVIAIAAVLTAACSQPATSVGGPAGYIADPEIARVVAEAMLGVTITGGETDGSGEYEITGTLEGQEYEFDVMGPDGGWRVVEIQRDIVWGDAPAPVRDVVATAPNAFLPERVIESRQPVDGAVVYELFAAGQTEAPAMEVRFMDGEAAIMPPAH
jgi:hypothetical protein